MMNKMKIEIDNYVVDIEKATDDFKGFDQVTVKDLEGNVVVKWYSREGSYEVLILEELKAEIEQHIERDNRHKAWRKAIEEQGYTESWFTIDGYINGKGIHKPLDTWNGWNNPYFTIETWKDILSQCEQTQETFRIEENMIYIADTNWCDCENVNGCEDCKEYELYFEDFNGERYFNVSGWCWGTAETKMFDDLKHEENQDKAREILGWTVEGKTEEELNTILKGYEMVVCYGEVVHIEKIK